MTSQVCRDLKRSKAAPSGLSAPLRALPDLVDRYGYRDGGDSREGNPDYCRVLDVDIGENRRLVVCRDEMQVIEQKQYGVQSIRWEGVSFHMTQNYHLKRLLGE